MYTQGLKELVRISQAVGNSPDLVQGGGGNTSVKLNHELMAVKASGFQLKQITDKAGFVVVNHKKIKEYYENVDLGSDTDFEKESVEFVKKQIVEIEGLQVLRPSVETGFHSILKKYVIHTHPVYANILCCSKSGRTLVNEIFGGKEYACLWIPYINPGFCLTLRINEGIASSLKNSGKFPKVIFMENHGLIVNADDADECMKLHEEVNALIRQHLGLEKDYPEITLRMTGENTYVSETTYLTDFFRKNRVDEGFLNEFPLYPDQLVYLNGSVSFNQGTGKLDINTVTGELLYRASFKEAMTIEETLLGYIYVIDHVKKSGLELKTMSPQDVGFINNWESEKYRKSLLKSVTGK